MAACIYETVFHFTALIISVVICTLHMKFAYSDERPCPDNGDINCEAEALESWNILAIALYFFIVALADIDHAVLVIGHRDNAFYKLFAPSVFCAILFSLYGKGWSYDPNIHDPVPNTPVAWIIVELYAHKLMLIVTAFLTESILTTRVPNQEYSHDVWSLATISVGLFGYLKLAVKLSFRRAMLFSCAAFALQVVGYACARVWFQVIHGHDDDEDIEEEEEDEGEEEVTAKSARSPPATHWAASPVTPKQSSRTVAQGFMSDEDGDAPTKQETTEEKKAEKKKKPKATPGPRRYARKKPAPIVSDEDDDDEDDDIVTFSTYCEICDIKTSTPHHLNLHKSGKKHIDSAKKWKKEKLSSGDEEDSDYSSRDWTKASRELRKLAFDSPGPKAMAADAGNNERLRRRRKATKKD